MTRTERVLIISAALLAVATSARAQDPGVLIEGARAQIDAVNGDSAFALLQQVLNARTGVSDAQKTRSWTLLGIAELVRNNRPAALLAFQQALRRDAALTIDSLADLASEARVVFSEARTALGIGNAPAPEARAQLSVEVSVPGDTSVPPSGGLLRIESRPSYRSRVVVTVTPADAPTVIVWSDTQQVGGIGTRTWNLRGRDGALVGPGRYSLRARAIDSTGQVSPERERILLITRVAPDTAPMPPALTPSAFAPETLQLRRGAPGGLAAGLAIAAAAAFAPGAMGNADIKAGASYGGAFVVAGAVSVVSVVGYLNGHRALPQPENALRNQQLRERDAAERRRIAQSNAQAREAASVRVRLEGAGP